MKQASSLTMPRYQRYKQVWALEVEQIDIPGDGNAYLRFKDKSFEPFIVKEEWVYNRSAQPGGYFVLYNDGYISFSPRKAFEQGYTLEDK